MQLENAISIMALLSDAQESYQRGQLETGRALINEAKRALFETAHQDANTGLSFEKWLEANNAFFSEGETLTKK